MEGIYTTTEAACYQIATTASLNSAYNTYRPITVYTGTGNVEDLQAPAVVCRAESATEDFPLSGLWHVRTSIICKEMAHDSTVPNMDTFIGDIQQSFLTGSIDTELSNAVPDYFVYQVLFDGLGFQPEGDAWIHTLNLDILCTISGSQNS